MSSPTGIVQAIRSCVPENIDLLYGVVTSPNPITIRLRDDSNLLVSSVRLVVPEHLSDREVNVTIDGVDKTITIKDGLKKGDSVIVLNINRGSSYLIVGRG